MARSLLLELAGAARVEGQVSRIVRARRQLVDEQFAAAGHKEFDTEDANVVEGIHHCAGRLDRPVRPKPADTSDGAVATSRDVMAMDVFDRTEI